MKSIKTKITVLVLSCLIISSCAIAIIGAINTKKVIQSDSYKIMELLCEVKTNEFNSIFSEMERSVKTLKEFITMEIDDIDRLQNDAEYAKEKSKYFTSVAINETQNTYGAMAVYLRFNPEFTTQTAGLFCIKHTPESEFEEEIMTDISLYDKDDVERVGWFYIPQQTRKGTWLDLYYNKNIGVEMISYVIPIYINNIFIGIVGMDIDFKVLQDMVKSTSVYDTGYAFLTDENAKVLYHRKIKKGESLYEYKDGAYQKVANAISLGEKATEQLSYSFDNQKKNATIGVLKNNMRFVITTPASEINKTLSRLIYEVFFWIIVVVIISVIVSIFIARKLSIPIIELNTAAQKIAGGDLSVEIKHRSKDEIGALSESFRKTAAHLKRHIEYINGLAYKDMMTGTRNRTSYLETVEKINQTIKTENPNFAVVIFDINNLKEVNDTKGHDFGDIIIAEIGKIIKTTFKDILVYRIGGDEFLVILNEEEYANYSKYIEVIEKEIDSFNAYSINKLTLSIAKGMAIYNTETDSCFNDVFKRADSVMYTNKDDMKSKL